MRQGCNPDLRDHQCVGDVTPTYAITSVGGVSPTCVATSVGGASPACRKLRFPQLSIAAVEAPEKRPIKAANQGFQRFHRWASQPTTAAFAAFALIK